MQEVYFHSWFYLSIYTFRGCILLLSHGYYFEANLLNRNLVEVLGKMRYFVNHKSEIKKFENIENFKSGKYSGVNFRQMFDEVFPGYYTHYKLESHIAHGGIGARLMKIKYNSPTDIKADTGVFFNAWRAGSVINEFTIYMLGYLRFYKKLFPSVMQELPEDTLYSFQELEGWIQKCIQEHIDLKGGENEWHKQTRAIWDF